MFAPTQFAMVASLSVFAVLALGAESRAFLGNQDESKVPSYTLPDPLVCEDGGRVTTPEQWRTKRRPELLRLFSEQMYGKTPKAPEGRVAIRYETRSETPNALGGKATRREVRVHFTDKPDGPHMDVMLYLPNGVKEPAPALVGLNFNGNHAVDPDPSIPISRTWMRNNPANGYVNNRATEESRGSEASRWSIGMVVDRGYALATACYNDIDPDFDDGFQNGIHPLFYKEGQTKPAPDEWGSIGAWAWGLSRILDYLESEPKVDATRVAVLGHSRLGKTALWAGAQDERFAVVISNNSGEGGASLARRRFGETTTQINTSFPHWFCDNYTQYNDREDEIPFDQHELIALIAPRAVLVESATEDAHADPKGEFLSALGADSVYRLLGTDGMAVKEQPAALQPVLSTIGYHLRPGKHNVTDVDWKVFLDFADKHMPKRAATLPYGTFLDRLRGGWAGQMIGVSYAAPYEFHALGRIQDEPIRDWKPEYIENSIEQDDLYVEMTFLKTLAEHGIRPTVEQVAAGFRESRYKLWHANKAGRDNLRNGMVPPGSGHPTHNAHSDDIDFQIEADLFGLIAPGLPNAAVRLGDPFGRIMNYGDGLYGGYFIAAMYAQAYLEEGPTPEAIARCVSAGLAVIPEKSRYAMLIRDVVAFHKAHPDDWRGVWKMLEEKWAGEDQCPDGLDKPFNIDAKLNGGYVAAALLYGGGEMARTLEVATRLGQDSDCNASSSAGVLGALLGYSRIPSEFSDGIPALKGRRFSYTSYDYEDLIATCERIAVDVVADAGGRVVERDGNRVLEIPKQEAKAPTKREQLGDVPAEFRAR